MFCVAAPASCQVQAASELRCVTYTSNGLLRNRLIIRDYQITTVLKCTYASLIVSRRKKEQPSGPESLLPNVGSSCLLQHGLHPQPDPNRP